MTDPTFAGVLEQAGDSKTAAANTAHPATRLSPTRESAIGLAVPAERVAV